MWQRLLQSRFSSPFQEIGQGGEQAGAPAGIVFERNGDLYAIAVDGSRTARLTNTPTDESTPAVSPDGRSIAFASDARRGIWIMGLHGRRRVRLTRGADASPAWTGNAVNYKKNDHYYEEPTWSPDGGRLAFLD